jgi:peptidoglycan lytic transglycosylase G
VADARERTPEEREAARLERERRRRGQLPDRGYDAPLKSPNASENGDGEDHDAYEDRPEDHDAYHARPEDHDAHDDYEDDHHAHDVHQDDHDAYGDHQWEAPAGTRRVGWRERTASATRSGGAGGAAAPVTQRPAPGRGGPRPSRRRSLLVRGGAILALLIAAALIWFCVELFQPFHGPGHGSVTMTVPAHAGARQVGDELARKGVVASGFFFYLRAKLAGDGGKLLAGTYHLKLDMSYSQALKALTTPPPAAKVTNVTVIPGETRAQLSARLRAEGIPGNYQVESRRSRLLDPRAYGAPRSTPSLEGFMFPDTYQLREPVTLSALIADQLTTFKHLFAHISMTYARSRHLTPYDVLIIASIVERESATRHDDPLVASVIYNRLKDHIPLGMDSTTRYEFNDYTKPLTQSQLAANSPYNTRLNAGLPPTPISNPGLAAIRAAAHPTQSHYLYFVVKPCGNGASVFSSSYSQFQADSARYQRARAARGGNSPTKC